MSRSKKLPPIHPSEILLEEVLKPLGVSMNKLAESLHVPANRITQIVEGRRSITGETALRLARYYGTSPEFWLGCSRIMIQRSRAISSRRKLNARFSRVTRPPEVLILHKRAALIAAQRECSVCN